MVYLEAAIQGFPLMQSFFFRYTWGIPVYVCLWGDGRRSHFQQSCKLLFLNCFSYFVIYCVNGCFWATTLSACFIILSTLFIFNLTRKESFLESFLCGWIFVKYLVLHQLFIKHELCIGNLERFPSQMINSLT